MRFILLLVAVLGVAGCASVPVPTPESNFAKLKVGMGYKEALDTMMSGVPLDEIVSHISSDHISIEDPKTKSVKYYKIQYEHAGTVVFSVSGGDMVIIELIPDKNAGRYLRR